MNRFTFTEDELKAVALLNNGASGDAEIESNLLKAFLFAYRVFQERQKKYGRSNIARAGAHGVVIRLGDKMARLEGAYLNGRDTEVPDETIEDTWVDVANYGLIGLMCRLGYWPGASK